MSIMAIFINVFIVMNEKIKNTNNRFWKGDLSLKKGAYF